MTLWENKVPNGVILPSENTDWTANVADECIVDTWALAKINFSKSGSSSGHGGQSSGRSSHPSAPEASSALILHLQDLGVQAIVIQIKLVDSRYNVVLGEFYDPENFCSHFIWFPISHLSRLDYPLPPRSIGLTRKTVTLNYLKSISNINSLYARKTLIKFFSSYHAAAVRPITSEQGEEASVVAQPEATFRRDQFGELQFHELISWSVQEEFSGSPFSGWIQDLNCALPVSAAAHLEQESTNSTQASASSNQVSVQQLIKETSDKIILERLLSKETSNQQGEG